MKIFPINTSELDIEIELISNKLLELKEKRRVMESNQLFQCTNCNSFSTLNDLILIIQQILVDDVYTQSYEDGNMILICNKCNIEYLLSKIDLRKIPEIHNCDNILKQYKSYGYTDSYGLYKHNGEYEKYPGRTVTKEEIQNLLGVIL